MEKINHWDLRIGNVISFNGELCTVYSSIEIDRVCIIDCDVLPIGVTRHISYKALSPVPATKENLEICGIKFPILNKDWIIDYTIDKNILIFEKGSGGKLEINKVKFIHDIQNIILDLTKIRVIAL